MEGSGITPGLTPSFRCACVCCGVTASPANSHVEILVSRLMVLENRITGREVGWLSHEDEPSPRREMRRRASLSCACKGATWPMTHGHSDLAFPDFRAAEMNSPCFPGQLSAMLCCCCPNGLRRRFLCSTRTYTGRREKRRFEIE